MKPPQPSSDPAAWAPALPADALPPLVGEVSASVVQAVEGWLLDPANPHRAVAFEIEIGGAALGRHLANRVRGDRPGAAGFRVALPPGLLAEGDHRLRIRDAASGRLVEAGITVAATGEGAAGGEAVRLRILRHRPDPPAQAADDPAAPAPADHAARVAVLDEAGRRRLAEQAFTGQDWALVVAATEGLAAQPGSRPDLRLLTWRGRALNYMKRHEEAAQVLGLARSQHGDRPNLLFYLGVALANLHRLDDARDLFLACVRVAPNEARYALEAARVTARLVNGDHGAFEPRPDLLPEAIELARRAAALNPRDQRPQRDLANLVLQAGRTEEGLALMAEAVARAPDDASLRLEFSRVLTRAGHLEAALEAARHAVLLEPLRDGAAFAVRILERWLEARRGGAFETPPLAAPLPSA